ncbi:MAG: hypothetical protein N7Q72_02335, partial [Spiroplasma sp. Tabriz.8]|nr:hypothetical protein [Spiroplasma sp. Tabriz.8]
MYGSDNNKNKTRERKREGEREKERERERERENNLWVSRYLERKMQPDRNTKKRTMGWRRRRKRGRRSN